MKNIKLKKVNKKIIILLIIVMLVVLLILKLINIDYKKQNIGNNNSNKTLENIEDYILSIKNYELTAEITINSNKNTNKYIIKQIHTQNNTDKQIILEPSNLAGIEITYQDGKLEVKNSNLNLSKIYNNYPYIESNNLWLNSFIKEYEEANQNYKKIEEDYENIIISVLLNNTVKKLYINKSSQNPSKLIIQDNNQKDIISILYNEININF